MVFILLATHLEGGTIACKVRIIQLDNELTIFLNQELS
jgi:hypothetical protein